MTEYYDIPLPEIERQALTNARSVDLLAAIEADDDYSVVQCKKGERVGYPEAEHLIVEVKTEEVPARNAVGIRYRERLAISVPSDPKAMVDVFALRKDFPLLIHQNATAPDHPKHLCLYFEPPGDVSRTWTPQRFLRRIQWWLEMSAKERLHAADQPVENLFFTSRHELVLPWNFGELLDQRKNQFDLSPLAIRKDKATTLCLRTAPEEGGAVARNLLVPIALPPVEQGHLETHPRTMAQLSNRLQRCGISLVDCLNKALEDIVPPLGIGKESEVDMFTVFLLNIPICRKGGEPEKTQRLAFLGGNCIDLGMKAGLLDKQGEKYFRIALVNKDLDTPQWDDEELDAMAILYQSDPAKARYYSGIEEEGPKGVIIGVGALGSPLLDIWGRGGWGEWTVVDHDHVKPHNLARHTSFFSQVGRYKAEAVCELQEGIMDGARSITPIVANACDRENAEVGKALQEAELVIDVTTSLEYPRLASTQDKIGRNLSVFITPSGHDAVLMSEDAKRKRRLRTLEAQYYRAVIENSWGKNHLEGNLGTVWSGAGCRDISFTMGYGAILAHAGLLADQIRMASTQGDALIRVWRRDPEKGSVEVHDVPVYEEHAIPFGDLTIFVDEGVIDRMRELRLAHLPNETGGVLLGYVDFNVNALVVVDALPEPLDSNSDPTSFERGVDGVEKALENAALRTDGVVGYVGEWHSHPTGCSAAQSGYDMGQLRYLAEKMKAEGLPAIQLIVGERDAGVFLGKELP